MEPPASPIRIGDLGRDGQPRGGLRRALSFWAMVVLRGGNSGTNADTQQQTISLPRSALENIETVDPNN